METGEWHGTLGKLPLALGNPRIARTRCCENDRLPTTVTRRTTPGLSAIVDRPGFGASRDRLWLLREPGVRRFPIAKANHPLPTGSRQNMTRNVEFFLPGSRIGVLLIHGLTGTPMEMLQVGRGLNRAGMTVLGVQLAGHCGTEDDLLATGWRDWYASVVAALSRLSGQADRIFVGGLSMGAILALQCALDFPETVVGTALYSPTFIYDGWAMPLFARLSFMLPLADLLRIGRHRRFMESFPYGIKNERIRGIVSGQMLAGGDSAPAGLAGNPWPSLSEFFRLRRRVQRNLGRVTQPCLVMHASHDDVASFRNNAELVQRRLGGPVEMVELHESYHMITVDQERNMVIARSVEFFERMAADAARKPAPNPPVLAAG
jgi:carboxylesterase